MDGFRNRCSDSKARAKREKVVKHAINSKIPLVGKHTERFPRMCILRALRILPALYAFILITCFKNAY